MLHVLLGNKLVQVEFAGISAWQRLQLQGDPCTEPRTMRCLEHCMPNDGFFCDAAQLVYYDFKEPLHDGAMDLSHHGLKD